MRAWRGLCRERGGELLLIEVFRSNVDREGRERKGT